MMLTLKHAIAAIILVLSFSAPVAAGPLEDAVAAAHKGEYAVAHQLLLPLAENGDARAQFNVGYMYANGWGVQRDYAEAVKWYVKAADQGLPIAQHNLGMAYAYGDGVAVDPAEAAKWYRRAANQGYPSAQFILGRAYANGWGVPQDLINAYVWVSLSALRGVRSAAILRGKLTRNMSWGQLTEAQKIVGDWKPKPEVDQISISEAGHQELLGIDHHVGEFADPAIWPVSAVGAVTIALYKRRAYCTGTLVGPKLVLTAAHCFFSGKQLVSPGNVHFLAGMNRGVPSAYSVAEQVIVSKEFSPGNWSPERSATDWALIILKNPLSIRPVPVKAITREQLDTISKSGTVAQIGYGAERRYSPSIGRSCRLNEAPDDRTFIVRCLTNFGYSGSPILAEINGTPTVIGIDSAGSLETLQGTACSANQFEKPVMELITADLGSRH